MEKLTCILNWREYHSNLSSSGQIDADQISLLAKAGVRRIINLGPHAHQDALANEAEIVAANGLAYTYLPIAFDAPRDDDFHLFSKMLNESANERLHIHCIYNARVTAFLFRYAKESKPEKAEAYRQILESVWKPGGVWAKFIGDQERAELDHQYAGRDY